MPEKQPCPDCGALLDSRGLDGHRRLAHRPMRGLHEAIHENSKEVSWDGNPRNGPATDFPHGYRPPGGGTGTLDPDPAPSREGPAPALPGAPSPGSRRPAPGDLTATFPPDPTLVMLFNRLREMEPEDWNDGGPWSTGYAVFLQASARLLWRQAAAPMELKEWVEELR